MERPMNTASRDRLFHKTVNEYLRGTEKRHTPVTRLKVAKGKDGAVNIVLHTSRPAILRMESNDISSAIKEQIGEERAVNIEVVAEARAVAKFIRCSARKARFVIETIKGKRVSEALALLRFIPNIASEPLSKVLKSAAANAQDGWGALPEELKIANFIADGGPTLKRVRPRAQGRAYRILKRTSHLTVILTEMPAPIQKKRPQGKPKAKTPPPAPKPKAVPAPAVVAESTAPVGGVEEITPVNATPVVEQTAVAEPEVVAAPEEATPVSESEAPEQDGSATSDIQAEANSGEAAEPNQE